MPLRWRGLKLAVLQAWVGLRSAARAAQLATVDLASAQVQERAVHANVTCLRHCRGDRVWVGFADGNVALWGPKGVLCSHVVCSKQAIS